jgi:tetratricopeptide (TPR) repeat protein
MKRMALLLPVLLFPFPATGQAPASNKLTHNQFSDWLFHHNAGWKSIGLNKLAKAEYCFKEAIKVAQIEVETDPRLMARSYGDLAWVLHLEGRDAEAEPLARWALTVREKTFGAETVPVAQTMYTLASIDLNLGQIDDAESLLTRTLSVYQKTAGPHAIATADALDDLATVLAERRQYAKASRLFHQALTIFAEVDTEHKGQMVPLDGLARIEIAEGRLEDAERHLDRLIALLGKGSKLVPEFTARVLSRKAEIYRKTGRPEQAKKAEDEAKSLRGEQPSSVTMPGHAAPGNS